MVFLLFADWRPTTLPWRLQAMPWSTCTSTGRKTLPLWSLGQVRHIRCMSRARLACMHAWLSTESGCLIPGARSNQWASTVHLQNSDDADGVCRTHIARGSGAGCMRHVFCHARSITRPITWQALAVHSTLLYCCSHVPLCGMQHPPLQHTNA